ncbi:hypothetical protein [Pseudogemmobacter blasticus]|nr:hypothetical protein [Fuscovulum blasticum]
MIPSKYREAHQDAGYALGKAQGYMTALYTLVMLGKAVDHSHPDGNAIATLCNAIEGELEAMGKKLDEAWNAVSEATDQEKAA